MNWRKPARFLLKVLAAFVVLSAFVVLDWYPTVKGLGRLRHELNELKRKIRNHEAAAAKFTFPNAEEGLILAQSESQLLHALPLVENDGAWLAFARSELLARDKDQSNGITIFSAAEDLTRRQPELSGWLKIQVQDIGRSLKMVDPSRGYPWRGVFFMKPDVVGEQLAFRPLGVALEATLPALLSFINHVSWGEARLEIVFLRLEPIGRFARVWMVCRGSYLLHEPSTWSVKMETGAGSEGLLIDPDSPLLLQSIDPLLVPRIEKRELPPALSERDDSAGSPW